MDAAFNYFKNIYQIIIYAERIISIRVIYIILQYLMPIVIQIDQKSFSGIFYRQPLNILHTLPNSSLYLLQTSFSLKSIKNGEDISTFWAQKIELKNR